MSLNFIKRTYVDGETVITADNLNDMQDAILELDDEKYEKPSGGIPKTDLASSVRTSLGKADTALQASQKGAENGVASLDNSGKVPIGQLPVDSALSDSSANPAQNRAVTAGLNGKAPVIYDTASGAVACFPDGADGLPLVSLTAQIEPVQDLHGYSKPWPGGGGNNLLQLNASYPNKNGVTYTPDPATGILTLGGSSPSVQTNTMLASFSVVEEEQYYISGTPIDGDANANCIRVVFRVSSGGSSVGNVIDIPYSGSVISVPTTATVFDIYSHTGANADVNNVELKPLVAKSDIAIPFEPYSNICPISGWNGCNISHSGADTSNPTVIPISWQTAAGTVYGGTLDVTTGVLTVSRRIEIVDGGKIQRAGTTAGGYNFIELKSEYFADIQEIVMADSYPVINALAELGIRFVAPNRVFVYDNRFVDLQTAKDIADTTNIQVLYALTTPVTYQLTPQEVATLLGVNNIWADCGPVAVEYPADTTLYIQKINAPSDDDMTADTQISSGKYFIVGGNLYLSTTTIPVGDTIIPGSNCVQTNLAEALNALNA